MIIIILTIGLMNMWKNKKINMKNIQQFESFVPEAKTTLDAVRFVSSKKTY